MQTEYEAKFVDVDHDAVRKLLEQTGAQQKYPMRKMRRTFMDFEDHSLQNGEFNSFVRVRDEGDKVTLTYKSFKEISVDGAREVEVIVSDYDSAIALMEAIGVKTMSYQETKREAWSQDDCEVVLDIWPWVKPFIEIEGPTTESVKAVAKKLGFEWQRAKFGGIMAVYRAEYPHLGDKELISDVEQVIFDSELPDLLKN